MWNPGLRGLAVVLLASSAWAGGSGWEKDIEQAFKKAKKSKSFLLVEFTDGKSSGAINKKIFKSSGFKRWAKGKVVLVEINYGRRVSKKLSEQYEQLKTKHEIENYPTVLLLDSEGTSHGALPFAADTKLTAWLTSADEVLEAAASPGKWFTDWAQAKRIARRLKRPMLVSFDGSDWWHYCELLHQEVYATEKFKNWAKKRVVLVQIDFPRQKKLPAELTKRNAALKQKYEVKGYPTVYFIDADEKRMGQRHGYIPGGVTAWIEAAEAQIR